MPEGLLGTSTHQLQHGACPSLICQLLFACIYARGQSLAVGLESGAVHVEWQRLHKVKCLIAVRLLTWCNVAGVPALESIVWEVL